MDLKVEKLDNLKQLNIGFEDTEEAFMKQVEEHAIKIKGKSEDEIMSEAASKMGTVVETAVEDSKNKDFNTDIVKAVYAFNVENAILPANKEVNSLEDLSKLYEEAIDSKVKQTIDQFPEEIKNQIYEYVNTGVVNSLSKDSFLDALKEVNLEENEIAEKALKEMLIEQGYKEDYINRRVQLMKDGEMLKEETSLLLNKRNKEKEEKNLLIKNKEKEEKAKKEKEIENYYLKLNELVEDSKTIWDIVSNVKDKQELKKLISIPVTEGNSKVLTLQKAMNEDPSIWVQVNWLFMKGILGKQGNLDALTNRVKSKATEQLNQVFGGFNPFQDSQTKMTSPLDKIRKAFNKN